MIVRVAMIASLVALPALVGCRDSGRSDPQQTGAGQQQSGEGAGGAGASAGRQGATDPTASRSPGTTGAGTYGEPGAGTAGQDTTGGTTGGGGALGSDDRDTTGATAQRDPVGDSGGSAGVSGGATGGTASDDTTGGSASDDTTGTGGTFAGRDEPSGSAPQGGQPRGVPIATASLQGNLTGTIQFLSGDDGDDVKNALVNVKGSQPGSYGVYLFKGSDCAQIRQMKSPFGQGEQGSGEPQGWKTVGSISLGAGQQQMSQLPLNDLSRDDLQDQSIVLFPIGSAGATPTSNATPAGCGQVQVTASPADQPSG